MYLIRNKICAVLIFWACGLFLSALAQADQYIYAGTLDPFHKTHEEEVRHLLKTDTHAKIFIYPIESAYYRKNETAYPNFFSWDDRKKIIETVFQDSTDIVKVGPDLRDVRTFIFDRLAALSDELSKEGGQKTWIYIGTDVLEIWKTLPGFEHFLSKCNLVVGRDPTRLDLFNKLKKQLNANPNIQFAEPDVKGTRSLQVNALLLSVQSPEQLDDPHLKEVLAEGIIPHLKKNWDSFLKNKQRYLTEIEEYYFKYLKTKIIPHLLAGGISNEICDWILNDQRARALIAQTPVSSESDLVYLASQLASVLPKSIRRESPTSQELVSKMHSIYLNNHLLVEAFDNCVKAQKLIYLGRLKKESRMQKIIETGGKLIYTWLLPAKKLLSINLQDLHYNDALLGTYSEATNETHMVTVYRGVSAENSKYLDVWLKEGFLSKTALKARMSGKSVEESIQVSQNEFQKIGTKNAAINHVLGEWRVKTPLISTTFDKNAAMAIAGQGGTVLTIQIPINKGLMFNDPKYWANTPWEKVGNPFVEALEFAIINHVPATSIVAVEKISNPPPKARYNIKGYLRLLETIPEMTYDRCVILFKKLLK